MNVYIFMFLCLYVFTYIGVCEIIYVCIVYTNDVYIGFGGH